MKKSANQIRISGILPILALATSSFAIDAQSVINAVSGSGSNPEFLGPLSSVYNAISSPGTLREKVSSSFLEQKLTPKWTAAVVCAILASFYLVRLLIQRAQGENSECSTTLAGGITITGSASTSDTPLLGRVIGASMPLGTLFGSGVALYAINNWIKEGIIKRLERKYECVGELDKSRSYEENVQVLKDKNKLDTITTTVFSYIAEQADGARHSFFCYSLTSIIALSATLWYVIGYTMHGSISIPGLSTFYISGPSSLMRPVTFLCMLHFGSRFLYAGYRLWQYQAKDSTTDNEDKEMAKILERGLPVPVTETMCLYFITEFVKHKPAATAGHRLGSA